MEQFVINSEPRSELGKGAVRRLRRQGKVPVILYGSGKEPMPLTVSHNELQKHLAQEAFYSHVLTINLGNKTEKAVLKDLQRHPSNPVILHADFQRVSETEEIHVHVPLHFVNEDKCIGVKQGGGVISRQLVEVEVVCLPKDLPEYIEVDMAEVQLNQIIHLSDLKCPAGVEPLALKAGEEHNLPVVSVHLPRGLHTTEGEEEAGQPSE